MVVTDLPSDGRSPRSHAGRRTCVGCRRRGDRSALLRVVAVADEARPGTSRVVPDLRKRLPGRGAWLHPDADCLDKAIARRAFGRALRTPDRLDLDEVVAAVEAWQGENSKDAEATVVAADRRKRVQR